MGFSVGAKYTWGQLTVSGGDLYSSQMNPSDAYPGGFGTIASGIFVPAGYWKKNANGYVYANDAITANAYNNRRNLNTVWAGAKWSAFSNLDFMTGFDFQTQKNYNTTDCTGTGVNISNSRCAGSQSALSLVADWRPFERMDVYAGVMVTDVYGGMASGFLHAQSYDPTAGINVRF